MYVEEKSSTDTHPLLTLYFDVCHVVIFPVRWLSYVGVAFPSTALREFETCQLYLARHTRFAYRWGEIGLCAAGYTWFMLCNVNKAPTKDTLDELGHRWY